MKTMEFNKIFGAATAALLIFLLAGFVSRSVYTIPEPSTPGFATEVASAEPAETANDAPAAEEDFATLLASVDPSAGAAVFRRCSACHKLEDGANGVGPHLYGVVGRDVGAVDGFRYSGALNAAAEVWGFDELNGFLTNPRGYAAGTSMGFAGLSNPRERAQVIAYLNAEGPSPLPLPTPATAVVEEEVAEAPADVVEEDAAPTEEVAVAETEAEAEPAAEVAEATADEAAAEPAAEDVAEAAPAAEPAPEPVVSLVDALAAADHERGAAIYANCALCHTLDEGRHGIAPSLHGVIGRDVAGVARFPYSAALSAAGGVWSVERLDGYLAAPADMGGHAGLPGLADAQARADVLAHVNAAAADAAPLAVDAARAAAPAEGAASPGAEVAEAPEAAEEVVEEVVEEVAEPSVAESVVTGVAGAAEAVGETIAEGAEAVVDGASDLAEAAVEGASDAAEVVQEGVADAAEAVAEALTDEPAVEEEAAETPAAEAAEPETEVAAAAPAPAEEQAAAAEAPAAPDAAPAAAEAPAAPDAAPAAAAGSDDPFVVAYLAATAADGQRQFRKCSACHRLEEGRNGVGPSLWNVVGRDIGSVSGFNYSNALAGKGGAWTPEALNGFIENPKGWAPGTKMAFAGLKKIEERAAVIRYLNESGDNPVDVP